MVVRGDVWLTALDPTVGGEIRKTRTCLIVSPDDLNRHSRTFLAIPMTSAGRGARYRPLTTFGGVQGRLLPDQIRTFDRSRLVKHLGRIDEDTLKEALTSLRGMFAY